MTAAKKSICSGNASHPAGNHQFHEPPRVQMSDRPLTPSLSPSEGERVRAVNVRRVVSAKSLRVGRGEGRWIYPQSAGRTPVHTDSPPPSPLSTDVPGRVLRTPPALRDRKA